MFRCYPAALPSKDALGVVSQASQPHQEAKSPISDRLY